MEQKVCANLECGHDRCPVKCKFFSFLFSCFPDGQTDLVVCVCYVLGVFADSFFFGRPSSSSASGSGDF